jgi:Fe2+ transport system protein FeoA
MKLSDAKKGKYIVTNFTSGKCLRNKCDVMGISIGKPIEIKINKKGMPIVIKSHSTYSIGRGIAEKILVKPKQ